MRSEQAQKIAKESVEPVKFEHWEGDESNGFLGSESGTAAPCGCIHFATILSDGSLGVGGWTEQCSFEHMD